MAGAGTDGSVGSALKATESRTASRVFLWGVLWGIKYQRYGNGNGNADGWEFCGFGAFLKW
jgi:hypothetical protein